MNTTSRPFTSRTLRSILLAAGCGVAVCSATTRLVPAQGRTFVVDAANGPGTTFTDLPPAVAAATDGDQIVVRPGAYGSVSTGKALTILAEGSSWSAPAIEISGLAAGRDFVLSGFHSSGAAPRLRVHACAGRVLLHRVQLTQSFLDFTQAPGLEIDACALVRVADSRCDGRPALAASDSTVQVLGSRLAGGAAVSNSALVVASTPALALTGGRLELTDSGLTGGAGATGAQTRAPSPALVAVGGTLRVAGPSATAFLAAGTGTTIATPALLGTLGSLRIDPSVQLGAHGGAPGIGGSIAVQVLRLPALDARGAAPGGTVAIDLFAPVNDFAALFVGQPADLTSLPGFGGDLGLDPARMLHIVTGTTDATGHLAFTLPVPSNPTLRGANWVWQSLSGTPGRGFLLSNSAFYINN
ncbi:MAG: hypothetical protein R3F56_25070 [Planctomycetota bacterium]